MVPSKVIAEIKQSYEALARQSIDPHNYTGYLFQVVFEIITADTFIAGIASKILDGEPIEPEDRAVVSSPVLIEERWWQCDDGQMYDVQGHAEVRQVAMNIEKLRKKCYDILISTNGF